MRYPLLFAAFGLVLMPTSAFAIRCSDGAESIPATSAQAVNGVKVGDPVCSVDQQAGITDAAGEAKRYLHSISTKVNTADQEHINKLNSTFATCAAEFLKAYTQKYGEQMTITSAWRSQADQQRVSTSPTSNHTRGLAIDVHPASRSQSSYDRMRDFAIANKQFGVCFARPMYNGSEDRPHMTAAGIGSRTEDCNKYGITKMCDAGGKFDPSQAQETAQGPVQTPTSGLTDALRQYLGGGQQPASTQAPAFTAAPATGATPTGGSIPTAAQPASITQPGYTAVPASSGSSGSSGGTIPATIAVPAYQQSGIIQATPVSNIIDTPRREQPQQDPLALLNTLARPTTPTQTATGTPLSLNTDTTQNIGTIPSVTIAPIPTPASTSSYALTPNIQTFTSQDLRYSDTGGMYTPPQNTTLVARTLETLRQTLVAILAKLQPFGHVRALYSDEEQGE